MTDELPRDVRYIVARLTAIHGSGHLRQEAKGLHLYLASPKCLEQDGPEELNKRHLTVNLDKYLGLGLWVGREMAYEEEDCAFCHKTDTRYTVRKLLDMPPLKDRGIKETIQSTTVKAAEDRELYCIRDGNGNLIPDHPGMVVPVTSLTAGHPAYDYLTDRGYNLQTLWEQFRTSYCFQETVMTNSPRGMTRRGYRLLPGGFRDTPQGRIIFYVDVKGVQQGWQARIIDRVVNGFLKQAWHPYEGVWVTTHFKSGDSWVLAPALRTEVDIAKGVGKKLAWDPSKYYTGKATRRSEVVMGFDAAVKWCGEHGKTTAVLSEGPLDAGRMGMPGMGMIGKYLNDDQAKLIAGAFRRVIYVADKGEAGKTAEASVVKHLGPKTELHLLDVSTLHGGDVTKKDLGDASEETCQRVLQPMIT